MFHVGEEFGSRLARYYLRYGHRRQGTVLRNRMAHGIEKKDAGFRHGVYALILGSYVVCMLGVPVTNKALTAQPLRLCEFFFILRSNLIPTK